MTVTWIIQQTLYLAAKKYPSPSHQYWQEWPFPCSTVPWPALLLCAAPQWRLTPLSGRDPGCPFPGTCRGWPEPSCPSLSGSGQTPTPCEKKENVMKCKACFGVLFNTGCRWSKSVSLWECGCHEGGGLLENKTLHSNLGSNPGPPQAFLNLRMVG